MASYAGTAAGSATEEIISYTTGEKELNWDNVKQSAVTVAKDTAIDGTIGIVTDRAIPKLLCQSQYQLFRLLRSLLQQ